ncbi:hypothetical protein [Neorhodopirellula lusitana]|nr:hypothetical protein [Neorhodopirellula lusitana]
MTLRLLSLCTLLSLSCFSMGCDSSTSNSSVSDGASEDAKDEYRRLLKESEAGMATLDEDAKAAGNKPD